METLWQGRLLLLCTGGRSRSGKLLTRRTPGLFRCPSEGLIGRPPQAAKATICGGLQGDRWQLLG
eukprot:7198341-Heterocapsa_arctica.AAC.1